MLSIQPPTSLLAEAGLLLHLIDHQHAKPLFALIDKNRLHLRQWLPWVDSMQSVKHLSGYISECNVQHKQGTDEGYVIEQNKIIVGRIGLHHIDRNNKTAAIGYWLDAGAVGNGVITKCCQTLLQQGFQRLQLNRIEIKCATANYKSAAVAQRLKFTKEGVLRQAEWVNDRFIDLELYSILYSEWQQQNIQLNLL